MISVGSIIDTRQGVPINMGIESRHLFLLCILLKDKSVVQKRRLNNFSTSKNTVCLLHEFIDDKNWKVDKSWTETNELAR